MTIAAKIIAHSVSNTGKEIVTFELEYPRFIHGEFMTHRLFSRNAASSRAIPVKKMIELVEENPAIPVRWGKNQRGMQASENFEGHEATMAETLWRFGAKCAATLAKQLDVFGLHKQIVNRVIEPFSHIKVVMTTTEINNFYWLRDHPDAQPEIDQLAKEMVKAHKASTPYLLDADMWHVPYFKEGYWRANCGVPLEEALAISSSCCAQVSFRLLGQSLEKGKSIYARLVESEPVHASPFEHQAKPMMNQVGVNNDTTVKTWEDGITHFHKDLGLGSGNFYGWIQQRQLIPNHCKW